MQLRLSGTQWSVVFWVIRNTHGWNRPSVPFTWYKIAQELGMNRAVVYRAGQALMKVRLLMLVDHELGVQPDDRLWDRNLLSSRSVAARQLWMPEISDATGKRNPLPGGNGSAANRQRKRFLEATVFRRAKDTSKDRLKTCKDRYSQTGRAHLPGCRDNMQRQHLAGAAAPIPGKYDGLSQD